MSAMQQWVEDNAKLVPIIIEAKKLMNEWELKIKENYNKALDIDKELSDINLFSENITTRDIETLNIRIANIRIDTINQKNKFNAFKVETLTGIKNISKYAAAFFKEETSGYKYVTEKTEHVNTCVTAGLNAAIGNYHIKEENNTKTVLPNNITWDINDKISSTETSFANLLAILDTLTFTIKSIRELLIKEG